MLAFIKMKSQKVTGLRSLRDLRSLEYARQCIIVAIVGLILVTSLGLGGFPPAIALAITIIGAIVILMMVLAE